MIKGILLGFAIALAATHPVSARPQRIVSISLCADVLLLYLAERQHIASVTFLAVDPRLSPVVERARGIPINYGTAEEVLALKPDLVLANIYNKRITVALLRKLGYPVLELDVAESIAATKTQIRRLAEALGEQARGERVISDMDARLAALRTANIQENRPVAALFRPGGMTSGRHTLVDELLSAAGLQNLAAFQGIDSWGKLSLEALLLGQPALLIVERNDQGAPSIARQILEHPALHKLAIPTVAIPLNLWTCAGPDMIEVVERLVAARGVVAKQQHTMAKPAPVPPPPNPLPLGEGD